MIRHLKNFNELALYAGVSCAFAFFVRLNPAFFYPVLLLRLSILLYCFYIIALTENEKSIAVILGAAIFIGWFGGYWDLFEIYLNFDLLNVLTKVITVIAIPLIAAGLYLSVRNGFFK
ncbi:MAG: hypothetical protein ACYTXY_00935 [Nostoc sp.]